jgi:hypothetical protein
MWILIITILAVDYRGGSAVSQIGPFELQESCMTAAKAWLDQVNKVNRDMATRALCVHK